MKCDQCEMVSINGVPCHETGCPNSGARWTGDGWVKQIECRECGCMVDDGEVCCAETIHDVDVDDLEDGEIEEERHCIVDGQYGIHVPTRFAAKFRYNQSYIVLNVTPADWDELERGPDVDGYWDLWDEICKDAEIVDQATGEHFTLEQDGDLFMVKRS